MLQGSNGRYITPESYIAGWLKELESPVEYADRDITLELGQAWDAPVTQEKFSAVSAKLLAMGRDDVVAELEQGHKLQLALHAECEILSAIFDGEVLAPWRIIRGHSVPSMGMREPALGYSPRKANALQLDLPRFMRISEKSASLLIQDADGGWRHEGWDFNYMSAYVKGLWATELAEPGSYRSRIKAYREAMNAAPQLPSSGVSIVIDTSVALEDYEMRTVAEVCEANSHARNGADVHLSYPSDEQAAYRVLQLPTKAAKWVISTRAPAPTEQLSLLAG